MHILIIDDFEEGREVAEAMLCAGGYPDISAVASAKEAYLLLGLGELAARSRRPVDLVLLDVLMPEIDGIEACACIRNDPHHSDVPIIMVTTLADTENLANAFIAGATDYITKPLNRVELLARTRSALRLKSELDRRKAREQELLELVSNGRHRAVSPWIDDVTGLFAGEVAEAYLLAAPDFASGSLSVIALEIDRLDACRSAHGDVAAACIQFQVACAVRMTIATVGVVAAIYHNGMMVIIAPEMNAKAAFKLGEAIRAAVTKLRIENSESITENYVTVSIAVAAGNVNHGAGRTNLLTHAVSAVLQIAAGGGNRVVLHQV